MTTYFVRTPVVPREIHHLILSAHWWPTLHYYGTVTLSAALSPAQASALDLTLADNDARRSESEDEALYAAETRCGA